MKRDVLVVALALALLAATAPLAVSADEHLEREAREIAKQLRCPICQNLSVADSPSPLAAQMRAVIHDRLEAGESREEIFAYLVWRYGEEVLLDPPKTGFSQLLWWGAAAIPLGGLALVALVLRRWLRHRPAGRPAALALSEAERREYEALLERELEGGRGGSS